MTIIYAVIIFCLLIFVHEFGHLIAAKATGVKVNEFALGMGPKLLKFRRGETDYSLRALPIGGFCAMEGEDEDSEDPRAFNNKSMPGKAVILAAGSFMNLLLAVVILSCVVFAMGTPSTTIASIAQDSPAAEAGVREGDRIVAIDGAPVAGWEDIQKAIRAGDGQVALQVERNGSTVTLESGFYPGEDGTQKIGITPAMERRFSNIGASLVTGVKATGEMGVKMVEVIGQLFTGDVSVKELTGPVGIVYAVGDTAKIGMIYVAQLTALISLNLAVVNMLPIPALDGGRLLFLVIRKVTGKKITDELEGKIHFVGIILLFGLMIFVTFQDITRFIL